MWKCPEKPESRIFQMLTVPQQSWGLCVVPQALRNALGLCLFPVGSCCQNLCAPGAEGAPCLVHMLLLALMWLDGDRTCSAREVSGKGSL